jgi:hypothetical protein
MVIFFSSPIDMVGTTDDEVLSVSVIGVGEMGEIASFPLLGESTSFAFPLPKSLDLLPATGKKARSCLFSCAI